MPIGSTTGSPAPVHVPTNHQSGGASAAAGAGSSSPPPVKVTSTDFKFELSWEPIKKFTLGEKPTYQWANIIFTWKRAGIDFAFVPGTPWEGNLKLRTGGKVTGLGVFDADGKVTYEKSFGARIFVSGTTGLEGHVDPAEEGNQPKIETHFIQNVSLRQYPLLPDGTGNDPEFATWLVSGGLHGIDVFDFTAGVQTP